MKVFISVDMEGIAGIVSWRQDEGEHRALTRELMTQEANAAIEGALAAGAKEIVVGDSHNTMINLYPDRIRPEARLISGAGRPLSMVHGVDESFAAAVFVGYHGAMGTADSVLDHTYSNAAVHSLRLNGRNTGEIGINAAACGYFGVPVVCVAGDEAAAAEARDLLGDVVTVPVKQGIGRTAADSLHPEVARQRIRDGVAKAVAEAGKHKPWRPEGTSTFEVTFHNSAMAEMAMLIPGAQRVSGMTVAFAHDDYLVAYKAMRAMLALASQVR